MALERGSTYIELRAKLDEFKRDLEAAERQTTTSGDKMTRTLTQKFSAFSKKTTQLGKRMSLGLTLPLVGIGALAINEFSEVQKVNAQTEAALKSTGGAANITAQEIRDLAASIGELSARDAEEIQTAQNVLLTFTKIGNQVGKNNDIFDQATLAIADMSARLGQDLQSSAIQLGKALNDPVKGISSLSRVGVAFTEEQKATIETLVEENDVLGAQKIILAELKTEFGGSAKAAGGAATPVEKLKLAFNDILETIGKSLMPVLKDVAAVIQDVAGWFSNLSPKVRRLILVIGGIAVVAGPVITAIGAIGTALAFLAANPIVLAVAAVAGLAIVIAKNWGKIKEVTGAVWNWVYDKIKFVWDYFIKWNPAVIFVRLIVENFQRIKSVVGGVFNWMVDKVNWVIDRVRTLIGWIRDAIGFLQDAVGAAGSLGGSELKSRIEEIKGGIGGGNLGNNLVGIGRNLQAQGFRITGHSAFPPVGGHTAGSMHYVDRAIDVNWGAPGESAEEKVVLNSLAAKLRATVGGIQELIYPATGDPDHQDHLHLAMDRGGIVRGPAIIHQGAITEAHIPLSGPGAGVMRALVTITNWKTGEGRMELYMDKREHSNARFGRATTQVAT